MSKADHSDKPTPSGSKSTRVRVLTALYREEIDRNFMKELNKRFNIRFIDGRTNDDNQQDL